MSRPIAARINIEAMRENLARVRSAAHGRTVWAVVKADAYGHGLENAVKGFEEADGLALLELQEAARARAAGWSKRILLIEGFFDVAEIAEMIRLGAETLVHSRWQIEALKNAARIHGKASIKAHIKVNSGMNRLGFLPQEAAVVKAELESIPGVCVVDIVTHFANAERPAEGAGYATVNEQLRRMAGLAGTAELCMANSAATLMQKKVGGAAVRAGIVLYGVSPDAAVPEEKLSLCPVMTLASSIIAVRDVAPGEFVGYGSRWKAERPSRIGVVACGYADGYPRCMPDGAPVWVEGARAAIAGAVSMDMITIDITDIPEAHVGSDVELWGEHVCVNSLASLCGTIGYELLTSVAKRVPRVAC